MGLKTPRVQTNLATGSVDVIFCSDTYHHFEYPQTMLADLKSALVPGGTMLVLDYDRIPGVSTPFIMDHVRANKQTVINEVTAAGFHLVEEVQITQLKENYLLRFEKR
ncbi:MAG: methyltransferase domain-containing protein [Myxococcota bacterium]